MLDERSYRGPNTPNRQAALDDESAFLGAAQLRWLKQALQASRATWKVIASDMPISIVVPDLNSDVPKGTYEAWANGDHGAPLGRELELASLFGFIKQQRDQERGLGDRRRPLRVGDLLRSGDGRSSPTSRRSGSSWPVRSTRARSAPARSIARSAPTSSTSSVPVGMKQNRPPTDGHAVLRAGPDRRRHRGPDRLAPRPDRQDALQRRRASGLGVDRTALPRDQRPRDLPEATGRRRKSRDLGRRRDRRRAPPRVGRRVAGRAADARRHGAERPSRSGSAASRARGSQAPGRGARARGGALARRSGRMREPRTGRGDLTGQPRRISRFRHQFVTIRADHAGHDRVARSRRPAGRRRLETPPGLREFPARRRHPGGLASRPKSATRCWTPSPHGSSPRKGASGSIASPSPATRCAASGDSSPKSTCTPAPSRTARCCGTCS